MNAQELFDLAPFGAFVTASDGTPRPPARFKKKLAAWEGRNSSGYFTNAHHADPAKSYDSSRFTLTSFGVITINNLIGLSDNRQFEVAMPAPGTILAYSSYAQDGKREISRLWASIDAAREWSRTSRYDLATCGYKYLIVQPDGALADYIV